MEKKTREIQKTETITYYEALDGTTFALEKECEKYEKSALGVIRSRIRRLIVDDTYNAWHLMGGYDDHTIIAVKMKELEDYKTVLQWVYAEQPWLLEGGYTDKREEMEETIYDAWMANDVVLFGKNPNDDIYFINSREGIISNLNLLDENAH